MNDKFRVLTLKGKKITQNIYLLNPGDVFQNFGRSNNLPIRKKASVIVERISESGTEHMEFDLNNIMVWKIIQEKISHGEVYDV